MLPNTNKTNRINSLNLTQSNALHTWNTNGTTYNPNSQHLCITSEDKIEKGNYYYSTASKTIYQKGTGEELLYPNFDDICKKIIATTDIELGHGDGTGFFKSLPQIPQQFIEQFIESYNKGEVITEVLVEYQEKQQFESQDDYDYGYGLELKVNQDNTINIKPIKDNWNREEVFIKMVQSFWKGAEAESGEITFRF